MPSRLRYEGTGLLIPQHIVVQKEAQLRLGMNQFMKREPNFSSGLCIIFKWAFVIPVHPNLKNITIYRVELLHLSTGETYCRSWEMKDNYLISDQELNHPRPFVLTGYLFPEWYQELHGNALYSSKNKSLEKALSVAIQFYKINHLTIKIYKAAVKISLPLGKEYGGIEYKLLVRASDSKSMEREYDLIVEVDPMEDKYKKSSPHKRATSLRKTRYPSPNQTREDEFSQTRYQISPYKDPKESLHLKLGSVGEKVRPNAPRFLREMLMQIKQDPVSIASESKQEFRPKTQFLKDRVAFQLSKKRVTAPMVKEDAERALTCADEGTVEPKVHDLAKSYDFRGIKIKLPGIKDQNYQKLPKIDLNKTFLL